MSIRVFVADDQDFVRAGLCGIVDLADDLDVVGEAATGRAAVDLVARLGPEVVLMDVRMPDLDGIEATAQITAAGTARVLILTTFDLDEYVYAALRAGASGFLLKDTPPADLQAAIRIVAGGDALLAPSVTRRLIARFAAPGPESRLAESLPGRLPGRERHVLGPTAERLTDRRGLGPTAERLTDRRGLGTTAGGLTDRERQTLATTAEKLTDRDRPVLGTTADKLTDREREVLGLVAEGLTNAEIGARLYITTGTARTHVARLLHKLGARDRVQLVIFAYRSGLAHRSGLA